MTKIRQWWQAKSLYVMALEARIDYLESVGVDRCGKDFHFRLRLRNMVEEITKELDK